MSMPSGFLSTLVPIAPTPHEDVNGVLRSSLAPLDDLVRVAGQRWESYDGSRAEGRQGRAETARATYAEADKILAPAIAKRTEIETRVERERARLLARVLERPANPIEDERERELRALAREMSEAERETQAPTVAMTGDARWMRAYANQNPSAQLISTDLLNRCIELCSRAMDPSAWESVDQLATTAVLMRYAVTQTEDLISRHVGSRAMAGVAQ